MRKTDSDPLYEEGDLFRPSGSDLRPSRSLVAFHRVSPSPTHLFPRFSVFLRLPPVFFLPFSQVAPVALLSGLATLQTGGVYTRSR